MKKKKNIIFLIVCKAYICPIPPSPQKNKKANPVNFI